MPICSQLCDLVICNYWIWKVKIRPIDKYLHVQTHAGAANSFHIGRSNKMFNQPTIESEWKVKIDTVSTRFPSITSRQVAQEASKSENRLPCKQCCQQLGKIGRIRRSRKKKLSTNFTRTRWCRLKGNYFSTPLNSLDLSGTYFVGDKHVSSVGDGFNLLSFKLLNIWY